MSFPVKYIDAGTIVAAIGALNKAIPILYCKPHFLSYSAASECLRAKLDLEMIMFGLEFAIKTEPVDSQK